MKRCHGSLMRVLRQIELAAESAPVVVRGLVSESRAKVLLLMSKSRRGQKSSMLPASTFQQSHD